MAFVLGQTQSQALTVVANWLIAVTGFDPSVVVQGQPNRVAAPSAASYIVFTPITRLRLSTNEVAYSSNNSGSLNQHTLTQSTQFTVQVDVYGPQSADWAQVISTEFRSGDAVYFFFEAGLDRAPLYTSDPRQLPFADESDQIQMRWSVDLVMNIQPGVTSPQDFADSLSVGIYNVDVKFPPV